MSLFVLPELRALISSHHSFHVKCACKVLKLILKSFGPVIKTNMATPPRHGGVDITKEERYNYNSSIIIVELSGQPGIVSVSSCVPGPLCFSACNIEKLELAYL